MDFKDFSWKMFEKTGDINIYLALKDDLENTENTAFPDQTEEERTLEKV